MTNLQQKMDQVQATNTLMKEDLAVANSNMLTVQQQSDTILAERDTFTKEHQSKMQVDTS